MSTIGRLPVCRAYRLISNTLPPHRDIQYGVTDRQMRDLYEAVMAVRDPEIYIPKPSQGIVDLKT